MQYPEVLLQTDAPILWKTYGNGSADVPVSGLAVGALRQPLHAMETLLETAPCMH